MMDHRPLMYLFLLVDYPQIKMSQLIKCFIWISTSHNVPP